VAVIASSRTTLWAGESREEPMYQKSKLPLGNRGASSSSAYLVWELSKISLPAEPAFLRGWSRRHCY